jgi:Kef-type K+ transport system membrane component KefB
MQVSATLLLELGVILTVLTVLGTAARRFALSPIPLYLAAGLALGEGGIAPIPSATQFVSTGASIGVVLLLLTLGLDFSIGEFASSLRRTCRPRGSTCCSTPCPAPSRAGCSASAVLASWPWPASRTSRPRV